MKLVILAGGFGKRLWPISTTANPKQISKIFGGETLLEQTFNRLNKVAKKNDIFVATNKELAPKIKKILKIPNSNIIIEPTKKDTCPAIAYAIANLLKFGRETLGFIPSDHFIANEKVFLKNIILADKTVQKTRKFVNFGIKPNYANINYGYLEVGEQVSKKPIFKLIRQIEKPNTSNAKKYIKNGYLWNGGYFFWTPDNFLQSFDKYLKIGEAIKKMSASSHKKILAIYNTIPEISLDYALIEKFKPGEGLTIKVNFGWEDLGSWEAIHKVHTKKDINENVLPSNWRGFDTKSCLIYAPEKKLIATMGIKDLIIVDTGKILLIMPKNQSGNIKKLTEMLEDKYL